MARPKAFREDEVLERAMRRFWAHGYQGTSIQDLVDATGINRASLYATFGDKQRLFSAAVDHYLARVSAERAAILDRPVPARQAIRDYFEDLLAFATGPGLGLGCMLTNTAVELAPHEPEVAARLRTSFARVEDAFRRVIERGQAAGDLPLEKDARRLARFYLGLVNGLRVLVRARAGADELRDVIEVGLAALD